MTRLRQNFAKGTVDDNPLLVGATTLNSTELADLLAVTGSDVMAVTLDPLGTDGDPEIIHITAHTAAATSATITRGQEGSVARQHASGTIWAHMITEDDFEADVIPYTPTSPLTSATVGGALDEAATILSGVNTRPIQLARIDRASSDISVNSITWINLDTGLDVAFTGVEVDDWVECGVSFTVGTEAVTILFDVVSLVGGTPQNSWGENGAINATGGGVRGWGIGSNDATNSNVTGSQIKKIVSGDLSAGALTVRLRTRTTTAAARTVRATTGNRLTFWAKLYPVG